MSDQEDDKKNLNDVPEDPGSGNQPKVDEENQPESEKNQNVDTSEGLKENIDVNNDELKNFDTTSDKKEENEGTGHQVIHKKDGRLHIYVRQDKYKGELKSKNWVGRLYIDGKQKISSSGTTNLEEAIPILEKWFDDVQLESERLKKIAELGEQTPTTTKDESEANLNEANLKVEEKIISNETSTTKTETPEPIVPKEENIASDNVTINNQTETKVENTTEEEPANKVSNIFGKLKSLKFKKPSLKGIKLPKSPVKKKDNPLTKVFDFLKSKIGKSSVQGEEVIGVELTNKEIRLAQINTNKSNQWVLDKFHAHPIDIPDESSVLENAEKVSTELSLALQKSKIDATNVAISIPVTSAIIRVVTSPLMKEEELQKAIETNSLWENLVQLTDNLDDYSIFHQVINRNEKDNTMDILFVASKLADINSYVSIVKNSGLNPVIIDVKCFALKSAVDQINQISKKTEDANLTAVLEFGLDENYLMILYDNNPIITDIFLRGQDRKILLESDDVEEKEALVRRYVTQVKQAVQDFETKYEKRIRNIKVVSDLKNVEEYLSFFRKVLMNVGFNLFDPIEGLKVPQQFEQQVNLENRSYLATPVGLAFRKLDVFGYYKFVTAAKNINLLPNRKSMFQQKKMKAISSFAFKGLAGGIAALYLVLFSLSFWNIHSYNKKLKDYSNVVKVHKEKSTELKKVSKELKLIETTLKLSRTLKSNKELTYRVLAQIASSVPSRLKFDQVDYDGGRMITIQGVAASDQDILKFIDNLGKQELVEQASLSSMRLPRTTQSGTTMKGFRVFVKIKRV
ncbi:pilus assembly protein PilM [Candidatus Pelagibacter sp.]|uniref:pilus assembly protein PilM n=1 Tax=Candidatus Pelagibacter sp. TaxID=2024849 RepID=UPI003F83E90E